MSIPATQLRPGMIIKHNNDLHSVFSVEHRTPGNLRAFIQAKLRNLRTGAMFEHRFRSPDPIEKVNVDEVNMEFLYSDGDDYYFMNTENYEQTHLTRDTLGDAVDYLTLEPADQGGVFRWQGRGHRVAANRRVDRDGSRARPEERDRVERDQAGEDRNRPHRAGAALHQRRREDQSGHGGGHVSVAGAVVRSEVRGQIAEVRTFGRGFHLCNLTSDLFNRTMASTEKSLTQARRFLVRGRVQGVGFRWFVEREAHILQIAGWVRNNHDGSVEVLAMGTREQLAGLRSRLREGPRAARVDDVEESEAEPVAGLNSFQVRGA